MYDVQLSESFFPAQTDTPIDAITIRQMVERLATERGSQDALIELLDTGDIGRTWTYSDLEADARKLAQALASRHEKGARIAVFANNIPEWVLLELAAGMAGLVLVTVNPSYQVRELKYVLEQSRSEAVYHVDNVRGNPISEIVNAACADNSAIKQTILLTDHVALYDGHDQGVLPETHPDDVVQIQYTSGTTGFPKGALLHHRGLIQNGTDTMRRGQLKPGDRFINMMPLFHTTGCAIMVLGGFNAGATMLLAPLFDPAMIAKVTQREKLNYLLGVPTMLIALMGVAEQGGFDLSCVDSVMSGGSMVPPELVRQSMKVFGCPIQIIYGQTEASPVMTQVWVTDSLDDLTGTIGQATPHMDISIRNPETNDVCPIGVQGEICGRGYNVMHGYNDNPEATAATIDKDGWLHTGDLGTMDARGYVKITGRVKEMIIRGGENIFPAEIENAMLEHPDIIEVAVVGVPDEKFGEVVACFMRSDSSRKPDAAALKTFIRERISPQKTPTYWIWVNEWPLTGSGKIRKFVLRDQFVDGQHSPIPT